jgi:hypothetical protein
MSVERLNFRDALGAFAPGEPLRGVLFLTYNLDGRWFEEVIAPELFDRAVDQCLLVRDGRAVRSELRSVRCVRTNAGYSTRVFHPKILLAVAERRAIACIGSANLTRGGYEKNLELGNVFEVGPEGGPRRLFLDLLAYIGGTLRREVGGEPLATLQAVESALREALRSVPAKGDGGQHRLLHNYETPLWDQVVRLHARKTIQRVLIISPFFEGERASDPFGAEDPPEENDGSFFERLFKDLRISHGATPPVTVCFQENEGLTRLPVETIRRYQKRIELRTLDWASKESRPLHAKLMVIEGTDADGRTPFLFAVGGSPNFTPAAMLRKPPHGNAELAFFTRVEGRRGTIDRVTSLLRIRDLFPLPVDVDKLRTIESTGPPPGPVERGLSDATLLVGENKVRLSLRGVLVGADRMRALAFIEGQWSLLAEVALGSDSAIEFAVPAGFFEELEGMPLALRADSIRVELYRGAQLLRAEELPLNVDCPDQFHGLHMVGPVLSSLDARIAQAGAGVSMTYRDQAKWLEALRLSKLQGKGLKVTGFQANLDQFFRHVHTGLRGHRERLRKNNRSVFTLRRTLRDLSRWLVEATSPDAVLPNDECRVFLIERLAEESENALRRSIEEVTTRAALPEALADTRLASALDEAVSWVRARSGNGSDEFCKQAVRALESARDSLRAATG